MPETVICACAAGPRRGPYRALVGCGRRGTTQGWYGWVGTGGVIPVPSQLPGKRSPDQRSGPRTPCRGGSGWVWVQRAPGRLYPPLRGPVGTLRAPPWYRTPPRAIPASWPIRTRLRSIFSKVSQNGRVSSKYVEKACHSPYIQKRVQKSPLDISRISIYASLLSQGINGPFLTGSPAKVSK